MNKRFFAALLACLICLVSPLDVKAETSYGEKDWAVTFTSEKKLDSNFKTKDMDDVIFGMQPGDTAVLSVTLANENESQTSWYMRNEVLSSLEDSVKIAKGAAYEYTLIYTSPKGEETVLFSSDTVGGDGNNPAGEEGLHQATNALKDYFYLDVLEKGQKGCITLTVSLEGETQGNDYQDTLADLQMNFAVELPAAPEKDITKGEIIKTGDDTSVVIYVISGLLGLLALVIAIYNLKDRKKAKRAVKVHLFTLLCLLGLLVPQLSVMAKEPIYTYTIRIYAGGHGAFEESDVIEYKNLPYGTRFSFQMSDVEIDDESKYYIKGIRLSGMDNNTSLTLASFEVTQDMDYVVAYGILGDAVAYTVNYVDTEGNALAESGIYYGNVGDRPVIAYKYIEGYVPQAYNLTGFLNVDASKNVFTFVYTRDVVNVNQNAAEAVIGDQVAAGQDNQTGGDNQAGGNNQAGGDNQTGGDNNGQGEVTPGNEDQVAGENNEKEPAEIVDINNDPIPLAPSEPNTPNNGNGVTIEKGIILLVVIVFVIAILIVVTIRLLHKDKEMKKDGEKSEKE